MDSITVCIFIIKACIPEFYVISIRRLQNYFRWRKGKNIYSFILDSVLLENFGMF